MEQADRVPPHSIELEQALLACCLLEGGQESVTYCIEAKIQPNSFYFPAHQLIFKTICDLYEEGAASNEIILCEKLQSRGELASVGGIGYINTITSRIDTPAHLVHYAKRVRELELTRRIIRVSMQSIEEAYASNDDVQQFIEKVEKEIFAISEDRISEGARHVRGAVDNAVNIVQKMQSSRGEVTGVPTGLGDLDQMTLGLHAGEMIVLAARPSMGKTALALNMAEAATLPQGKRQPVPTLIFSLEMSADQLATRLICSRARVRTRDLNGGFIGKDSNQKLVEAAKEFKSAPLWIDESSGVTILEMRAKARRLARQEKVGFIVIDYLQLLSGTDSRVQREQQISEISRGVKAMARELGVPVLVLSQLNRESEREKRQPRLSDLRESGAIEQDADVVLLLARHKQDDEEEVEGYNTLCDLIVAKHRNGPVGIVPLTFNKEITRFENNIAKVE